MKISQIYEKYKIMPQLQLHMLRVAGVASLIFDNFQKPIDKRSIISACLLHDLGNMAKIKLDRFPKFVQPLGTKYWEQILAEFKHKYGNNDYTATYAILFEIGIPKNIYNLVESLEFAKSPQVSKGENTEVEICLYSDARVSPNGVVSLTNRLVEVKERYMKNKGVSEKNFNKISESFFSIEKKIFAHCKIKPSDITENKVQHLLNDLRRFDIKTS